MRRKKIVALGGAVAQRPHRGGHTWVFLQYLLGFRDLGWDVLFLDRLDDDNPAGIRYLQQVMDRFGLRDYSLSLREGDTIGLPRDKVLAKLGESALLVNVNGFIDDPEVLERASLRAFLDIDPGFWHMWRQLGLHDAFRGHDAYITIGENIGSPDCNIPTGGIDWITTPQPIVLDLWPVAAHGGESFTTVGSWRGPFGPIEYNGETYGLRVHEFRRFAELPRRVNADFEIALDIHEAEVDDIELLRKNGWSITDPEEVAKDPWVYQSYIKSSKAEFGVAKNMYVRANSGWFSDRSICYLASGRPVLAQETGFSARYGSDEGLLAFSTLDEAAAGAEAICADYSRHARAARRIAEEHFDSKKVLAKLLDALGLV
jgi:hypothetical protein